MKLRGLGGIYDIIYGELLAEVERINFSCRNKKVMIWWQKAEEDYVKRFLTDFIDGAVTVLAENAVLNRTMPTEHLEKATA
jgi:hypothetical protein